MSIKKTLILLADFMEKTPSYQPSKLVVMGSTAYVLRVLKKHSISNTLTIRGVPVHCIPNPAREK